MLSNCWLLSDLDGTLISTPHKAQGQYLPITHSPCADPIRRWLLNGGNVCIVTTADQRVLEQVYLPLRACLAECESRCAEYHGRLSPGERRSSMTGGKLLLSLYTGAVLYLCTSTTVCLLPGYTKTIHCATRESVERSAALNVPMPVARVLVDGSTSGEVRDEAVGCVRGTCLDRRVSDALQLTVQQLYERFIADILNGEPVVLDALKYLSARYKRMWRAVLTFLEHAYLYTHGREGEARPPAGGSDFSVLFSGAQQSASAREWKSNFVRTRKGLLAALGILRVEYVEEAVAFGDAGPSGASKERQQQQQQQQSARDRELIVQHATDVLTTGVCGGAASVPQELKAVCGRFAAYVTALLGADPRDLKKRLSNAPPTHADVAQVIVLAIPLRLFSRYFTAAAPGFVRSGVHAMPQPNSIVFSKSGVSKSTTLRYLLGKDRVAATLNARAASAPGAGAEAAPVSYAGCVDAARALSLGDNPHTTDYELTVFDDVQFISVEKANQRAERHRRIVRRLQRTKAIEDRGGRPTMPDGTPAPSYAQLVDAQRHSGPMMDDRLRPNILYVGGEEEGTAVLLSTLMDRLRVPPLRESQGHVQREDRDVSASAYQRTLAVAHAAARRKVQASLFSHL